MSLERAAKNLDVELIHLELERGGSLKTWKNPRTKKNWCLVEDAVLGYFEIDGWRGYSKEGGLLLTLIKAMSFPEIDVRYRTPLVESIYYHYVPSKFELDWLLSNIAQADERQIQKNFRIMADKTPAYWFCDGMRYSSRSILDFNPYLEEWMLLELFQSMGNTRILDIARKFSEDPYEYRKGWPDLTIWKNGQTKFLEVKALGDSLQKSQRIIIDEFIKPLHLDFALVDVQVQQNLIPT